MPKIQWANLPVSLRDHLFDRVAERKITPKTCSNSKSGESNRMLLRLWYKDFGIQDLWRRPPQIRSFSGQAAAKRL
jgi:hypothetical protein